MGHQYTFRYRWDDLDPVWVLSTIRARIYLTRQHMDIRDEGIMLGHKMRVTTQYSPPLRSHKTTWREQPPANPRVHIVDSTITRLYFFTSRSLKDPKSAALVLSICLCVGNWYMKALTWTLRTPRTHTEGRVSFAYMLESSKNTYLASRVSRMQISVWPSLINSIRMGAGQVSPFRKVLEWLDRSVCEIETNHCPELEL